MPHLPGWKHALLRHHGALLLLLGGGWVCWALGSAQGWWRDRDWLGYFIASGVAVGLLLAWVRWQREKLIREAPLPRFLQRKLREAYPALSAKDCELVERGLRQFFLACLRSRRQFVAMPSRVVDALWHEFILHTRAYRDWCQLALGRFVHHTPAEALGQQGAVNDGLRRAWYWACRDEAIQPRQPSRLPLLFALDAKLAIANGFHYQPDCRLGVGHRPGGDGVSHCGTDFSDGSYSGGAGDFGGAESSGGDAADGGGDGGCGSGCGGGD